LDKNLEKSISLISVILTICGAVVFVIQNQISSLDQKTTVQIDALHLEIIRTRTWINKVSQRQSGKKLDVENSKIIAVLKERVDRIAYIVDDIKKGKH